MSAQGKHVIIVAGAGPAGMAVASSLSKVGHEVIILNRDIKFGGLAEYGIFPSKLKLRGGQEAVLGVTRATERPLFRQCFDRQRQRSYRRRGPNP